MEIKSSNNINRFNGSISTIISLNAVTLQFMPA